MARKTAQAAKLTRERILDAALSVFCDRGVSMTSLEHIAHMAGMTRGAVYWHFKDKNQLLAYVLARETLPLEALRPGDSLDEDIQSMADALSATLHDQRFISLVRVLLQRTECSDGHAVVRKRILLGRSRFKRYLATLLRRALTRGELPAHYSQADLAPLVLVIHGGIVGLLFEFLHAPSSPRKRLQIEAAIPLIFHAIASSPTCRHRAPALVDH